MMSPTLIARETERLVIQTSRDAGKTQAERNRLGQFSTPPALALDILKFAATLLPAKKKIKFLDPAIGTGAFYSALRNVFPQQRIAEALGFEIDAHYGKPSQELWKDSGLTLRLADFTRESASPKFDLIVCNPPYVRHHHLSLEEKIRLHCLAQKSSGMDISGLAGLYTYFLSLSHAWMAPGAVAGWLIPSEFMDVNYGRAVKHYLLNRVTLLHIHRFDPSDVQFADALVSSAIVWFRNAPPPPKHNVVFTFGGTQLEPHVTREVSSTVLAAESKWTRFPVSEVTIHHNGPVISDFFRITRGLATGDNSFFILTEEQVKAHDLPAEVLRSILPSPRYVHEDVVTADSKGIPLLERRLFLLDTRIPESEIKTRFPKLHAYLKIGKAKGLEERYICKHRTPWYAQEKRPAPPIVCTYIGRGDGKRANPFRFILNESNATVANAYLAMYPKPQLAAALEKDPKLIRRVWQALNNISIEQLVGQGRVYGGGMHKLEPKELGNVDASGVAGVVGSLMRNQSTKQLDIFLNRNSDINHSVKC